MHRIANDFVPYYASNTSTPTGIDCDEESMVDISDLCWVRTADRLPDRSGDYLTTRVLPKENGKSILCVTPFHAGEKCFMDELSYEDYSYGELMSWDDEELDITNEILAWMPWPKLYSKEVSE